MHVEYLTQKVKKKHLFYNALTRKITIQQKIEPEMDLKNGFYKWVFRFLF